MRALLEESEIRESHRENDPRVQDAYSLRCAPQVLGAVADAIRFAETTVRVELNASTDNPLVFADGDVISGGNFHGQPVAQALDFLAITLTTLQAIAERRVERLVNPDLSQGLPAFLTADPGLSVRLHDGPDHRRVAGGGVAGAGDAGQHRLHSDRRQPGGLRPHGHGRRVQGAANPEQRAAGRRRRSCCARRRGSSSSSRSRRGGASAGCISAFAGLDRGSRPPDRGPRRRRPTWSGWPRGRQRGARSRHSGSWDRLRGRRAGVPGAPNPRRCAVLAC